MTKKKLPNSPITPKKQAKQTRSKQTIGNILQATEQLIASNGLELLTTNKIAERAGVNIASFYQYFPNKEAAVNELLTQIFEKESQLIAKTINNLATQPSIHTASKEVIALAIKLFRSSENLLLNVFNYKGDQEYFMQSKGFMENVTSSGKLFLQQRQSELRIKNIDHALYVLSNSIIPLLINYLSNPPLGINDHDLVDEVSDLVCHYLLQ
jgi:AcrR family transcriptional regulator